MDPYIGEIKIFTGNFAPRGWATCDGQLLSISSNTALFSILGNTYGGNGTTTFGLPDLRGRVPLHIGQGTAPLSNRILGQSGGVETVTLNTSQIPAHTHSVAVSTAGGTETSPVNNFLAVSTDSSVGGAPANFNKAATAASFLAPAAVSTVGGGTSHDNMPPYLPLCFIIAVEGIYPSRP